MTETRIRWEPAGSRIFGYAGTLEPWAFQVWQSPSDFGDVALGEWVLSIHLPGPFSEQLPHGHDPDKLKAEAERWLEEFVSSLGAVFPADEISDDEDEGRPVEVIFAPGRRVRFAHPGNGYPGDGEQASRLLTAGEVYVIDWSDIGFSKTRISLAGIDSHGQGFNSVLFDPVDDEPAKEAGQ